MVETRNRTQSWTWTRGSCRVQVDRCTAAVRGCEEARWLAWCRPISQFSLHEQRIQTLQEPLDVSVKVSLCHFLTVSLPDQSFCPAQTGTMVG